MQQQLLIARAARWFFEDVVGAVARGGEENVGAVGRPSRTGVQGWIERQPIHAAATDVDHPDIIVAAGGAMHHQATTAWIETGTAKRGVVDRPDVSDARSCAIDPHQLTAL